MRKLAPYLTSILEEGTCHQLSAPGRIWSGGGAREDNATVAATDFFQNPEVNVFVCALTFGEFTFVA